MKAKKIILAYVVIYLTLGGAGFVIIPGITSRLLLSNADYGDSMPRLAGMFMLALAFLVFWMVRNNDWKYYAVTILLRSFVSIFLFWLFFRSEDPMFLVLNVIVLTGLLPSIVFYLRG